MAKKRPVKNAPAKAARPAKPHPAKPLKSQKPAARPAARPPGGSPAVVLFTLRDAGASALRFHSDHTEITRARAVAQSLANSPDVADAFVIPGIEIIRRAGQAEAS
jgi:hypothetical protein